MLKNSISHVLDITEIVRTLVQSPYFPQHEQLSITDIMEFIQFFTQFTYFEMCRWGNEDFRMIASMLKNTCDFDQEGFTKRIHTQQPSSEYQIMTDFFQLPTNVTICASSKLESLQDQYWLEQAADLYCSQRFATSQNNWVSSESQINPQLTLSSRQSMR